MTDSIKPITDEERNAACDYAMIGNYMKAGAFVRAYEARLSAAEEENSTLMTELYAASQALEEAAVDLGLCDARPAKKRTAEAFHCARKALQGKNDV